MTQASAGESPVRWFYRQEQERREQPFLTQPCGFGGIRKWTWGQAGAEARRIAAHLRSLGLEPGSRIGILSRNSAWWVLSDIAVWMAGYVSVPVYPSLKPESIRGILEHAGCSACFVGAVENPDAALHGCPAGCTAIALPTAAVSGLPRWDDILKLTEPLPGEPAREPGELATIIYTSGTTGAPKGVMHSFSALAHVATALTSHLGLDHRERYFSYMPLAHIVERCAIEAVSLRLGAQIFFSQGLDTFLADLQRAKPTIFVSVPRLLLKFQQAVLASVPPEKIERLLRIPVASRLVKRRILRRLGLSTVRHAACGAAPLAPEILSWFRRIGLPLAEGYGMTETLITHLPASGQVRPGYVGQSLPGVETRLGPEGEVQVRSPMNTLGYYRDPEGSAQAFTHDGFFRTGDVGEIAGDGQLRIVGRIKDQFKTSKGKYVAPAPIESLLSAHPAVEACCLVGAGLPRPFALVLLSSQAREACAAEDGKKLLEESFIERLEQINRSLDSHERVEFVALVKGPWSVANGALTPTMKVKRNTLEDSYTAFVPEWSARNQPVVWESDTG